MARTEMIAKIRRELDNPRGLGWKNADGKYFFPLCRKARERELLWLLEQD